MPNSVDFAAELPSGGFESGTTENCAALSPPAQTTVASGCRALPTKRPTTFLLE